MNEDTVWARECYDRCLPTPPCQLNYWPSPCICTTEGPVVPRVTSAASASGTVGVLFTYQIEATNSPTSFNAIGLPPGLTINTTTGMISGTPTAAGQRNVTVTATNAQGTGVRTVGLNIGASGATGHTHPAFLGQLTSANQVPDEAFIEALTTHANPTVGQQLTVPGDLGSFGYVIALPAPLTAGQIINNASGIPIPVPPVVMNLESTNAADPPGTTVPYNVYFQAWAVGNPFADPGHTLTIA